MAWDTHFCHELAAQQGGKCLSENYANSKTKLIWECDRGHVWESLPYTVAQGHWCGKCAYTTTQIQHRKQISDLQSFATSKGGTCLSDTYIGNRSLLKWKCRCGFIWEASWRDVTRTAWCPRCSGKLQRKIDSSVVRKFVEAKGGEFCSSMYRNALTRLDIKCAHGHIWETTWGALKAGSWCPYCSFKFIHEEQCRWIFQELTGKLFPKNHTLIGNKYQLDGYCEELKLAFEYDGKQHYEFIPRWHKTKDKFVACQLRDQIKAQRCQELQIELVRIPYTENNNLEDHIRLELEKRGIKAEAKDMHWNAFWKQNHQVIEECTRMAVSKGGILLSKVYFSAHIPMTWQCSCGHVWNASWNSVKRGHWCSLCCRKRKP